MSIRHYSNGLILSDNLRDVLHRNGMNARIAVAEDGSLQLIVKGHDSPELSYRINEQQLRKMTAPRGHYNNKEAYRTFTQIVKNDFHMPVNYTHAHNAGGIVQTGLHGYHVREGEYGYRSRPFFGLGRWGGHFTGMPRYAPFHMRRIGNEVFFPTRGGYVPVRPDGYVKPGEQLSGGYGFYWKGNTQRQKENGIDIVSIQKKELQPAPRPKGQATRYSDAITSDVYFTKDKFMDVLKSHGIVIDEGKSRVTIQSSATRVDLQYDLKPEELKKLTAEKLKECSLQQRLDILNGAIGMDFADKITKGQLETKDLVSISLKEEVKEEVERDFIAQETRAKAEQERQLQRESIERDPNAINGRDIQQILGNRGWFQPRANGRIMDVSEIRVDKTADGKFLMQAVINGEWKSHEITQKQYQNFLDLNDAERLRLFDKVFDEVKIKSAHGRQLYNDEIYVSDNGKEAITQQGLDIEYATSQSVDGRELQDIKKHKGFYREIENGRAVSVEQIVVRAVSKEEKEEMKASQKPEYSKFLQEAEKKGKNENLYMMTAVINGQSTSHAISQKEYEKFIAVDDYHRMKLFSKVFNEVDMKTKPGEGTNVGAAILAALVVANDVVATGVGIAHAVTKPEIYESHMHRMESPAAIASASYTAALQRAEQQDNNIHRGL